MSNEGLEFEETEEEKTQRDKEVADFDELCKVVKDALGDNVEKVVVSNRRIHLECSSLANSDGLRTWFAALLPSEASC